MQRLNRQFVVCGLSLVFMSFACNHAIPRLGVGGRYEEGKEQFLRGRGGDMEVAITALESVVSQDPTYKDSLTYLAAPITAPISFNRPMLFFSAPWLSIKKMRWPGSPSALRSCV